MKTIKKSATIKVMLSYDYNHFESSIILENEEGLKLSEINETRKSCNRLCDEAIRQYKKAKSIELKNTNLESQRKRLEYEVAEIERKKKKDRNPEEKAKVKALQDQEWIENYDYYDDEEYQF